jgi:membrane protein DedA with SNARE-associated domain
VDVIGNVFSLLAEYGYLIVFFGVMLESVGVPIPGETILISSGLLAQQGKMDVGDVVLFGILGAVTGDQIGYWIGREGGRPFVLRWGRYVLVTPERLARAEDFFARHGGKAVFLARFVAGLRVVGALVAGISHMHWRTFFFYNALGGATWATASVLVGYLLGGSLDLVERWIGRASTLLAILLVFAVILYLAYRWISIHPEQLKRAYERIGGRRLTAFLQSPAGLWLRRRFSPGEVYGLVLTVGLLFTGLFSWAFGGIVEDLLSRDPLVNVDVDVLRFIYSHGDPTLTAGSRSSRPSSRRRCCSWRVRLLEDCSLSWGGSGAKPGDFSRGSSFSRRPSGRAPSSSSLSSSSTGPAHRPTCSSSPRRGSDS